MDSIRITVLSKALCIMECSEYSYLLCVLLLEQIIIIFFWGGSFGAVLVFKATLFISVSLKRQKFRKC